MSKRAEKVLGANVKALRKARGWTQQHLSDLLIEEGVNIRQTSLAKLEGGTKPTTASELLALATVLQVGYDELLPIPAIQLQLL